MTDDDDSILSVLRQSEAEGTREEIGRKKAEQLLKFSKKRMCRWWPTNLYISTLNRTFMESMRQFKKRGEDRHGRTTFRRGSMPLLSINNVMALPSPTAEVDSTPPHLSVPPET